jgi:hypothetical protein
VPVNAGYLEFPLENWFSKLLPLKLRHSTSDDWVTKPKPARHAGWPGRGRPGNWVPPFLRKGPLTSSFGRGLIRGGGEPSNSPLGRDKKGGSHSSTNHRIDNSFCGIQTRKKRLRAERRRQFGFSATVTISQKLSRISPNTSTWLAFRLPKLTALFCHTGSSPF